MDLTRTISVLEVVWTGFCIPGLYYAIRLFSRATGDLVILRKRRINSIREYAAITTIIMFSCMTLVQFMFVVIGGIAMTIPKHETHATTKSEWVVTTGFILVSFSLDIMLFLTERRRQQLLTKIQEIEEGFGE